MSFDRDQLAEAVARQGVVVRVVVAASAGSVPRGPGAAMLVWAGGQDGTIGGGALEWQAVARARGMLAGGPVAVDRLPLGPALGQCCGGSVTLVSERFDSAALAALPEGPVLARRVGGTGEMPLAVARLVQGARAQGVLPAITLVDGWLVEPVSAPVRQIWVWGAGHVGRAILGVLAPLPGLAITWVDTGADRFPGAIPAGVTQVVAADPGALVAHAPTGAEHLVLTYSHAIDLDLCHRLLAHGFDRLGLIGSATKWARFRRRLGELGHAPAAIARIDCPIGDPSLGKHPQAIAVGVAAALLRDNGALKQLGERRG